MLQLMDIVDVVKLLLENGADINLKDKNDYTALMFATDKKHLEKHLKILEYLLENGAK